MGGLRNNLTEMYPALRLCLNSHQTKKASLHEGGREERVGGRGKGWGGENDSPCLLGCASCNLFSVYFQGSLMHVCCAASEFGGWAGSIPKTRLFKDIENLTSKTKKLIFFIFLLKTQIVVLVRTASLRRF